MWHGGVRDGDADAQADATAVIGFSLPSREAVDATVRGAHRLQVPSAGRSRTTRFWGARYAVVADPDGNDVGLMSPKDLERRYSPEV